MLVLEMTLQVWDLVPDFCLQQRCHSKDLDNILLLISNCLRPDEYGLTEVERSNSLNHEVDDRVHDQPVLLLEAKQASYEQQDRRLEERVVNEELSACLLFLTFEAD